MGNRVCINLTKFVDLDLKGNEVETTYGLRIGDDYDATFKNGLAKDEVVGKSPAEIIELARGIDERTRDMIAFAEESQDGIRIGDEFFAWTDIKSSAVTPN
jgi:hypothetical protein